MPCLHMVWKGWCGGWLSPIKGNSIIELSKWTILCFNSLSLCLIFLSCIKVYAHPSRQLGRGGGGKGRDARVEKESTK